MVQRNGPRRLAVGATVQKFFIGGVMGIVASHFLHGAVYCTVYSDETSVVRFIESNTGTSRQPSPLPAQTELFGRLSLDTDVGAGSPGSNYHIDARPAFHGTRLSEKDNIVLPPWQANDFTWAAPVLRHQPLYFEQVNLERYGQGPRRLWQPAYSAAHFFGSTALLPLHAIQQGPTATVYTLGQYSPGDCVPYQQQRYLRARLNKESR